jgi:hypothetical protein
VGRGCGLRSCAEGMTDSAKVRSKRAAEPSQPSPSPRERETHRPKAHSPTEHGTADRVRSRLSTLPPSLLLLLPCCPAADEVPRVRSTSGCPTISPVGPVPGTHGPAIVLRLYSLSPSLSLSLTEMPAVNLSPSSNDRAYYSKLISKTLHPKKAKAGITQKQGTSSSQL